MKRIPVTMPAKSKWLIRLPEIRRVLRQCESPVLDRKSVEVLFGVRPRRALQLIKEVGGRNLGKNAVIETRELMEAVEAWIGGDAYRTEVRRRRRVAQELLRLVQREAARRVEISVPPRPVVEGVRMEPGLVELRFERMEDLLVQLAGLSRRLMEDYDRMAGLLAKEGSEGSGLSLEV